MIPSLTSSLDTCSLLSFFALDELPTAKSIQRICFFFNGEFVGLTSASLLSGDFDLIALANGD